MMWKLWRNLANLANRFTFFCIQRMERIRKQEAKWLETHRRDQENAESGD